MDDVRDLIELRYPFTSAKEFFDGYLTNPAALHLVFAWIMAVLLTVRVAAGGESLARKLLALYFSLTLFNNPAFQVLPGSSLGDIFGVLCAITFFASARISTKARPISVLGLVICGVGVAFALHAALIGALYPELNPEDAGVLRFLVICKVFVFGIAICLFDQAFNNEDELVWLMRCIVSFAVVGILAYLIQAALLLTGTLPFGTYSDAGYVGFPSFGGVSIERGHFGKFLTPLFPLFLYLMFKEGRLKTFVSFVVVTLVNFSASSQSFFAFYVATSVVAFRRKLANAKAAALLTVIVGAALGFIIYTWRIWAGVVGKIYQLAVLGNGDRGGRDIGTFISYLETYPFGISYGGSSLRIAPGLDDINAGIFSFITQMSLLSAPLIAGFGVLVVHAVIVARSLADRDMRNVLIIGILAMPFIFATDVLWFVPTIWLPMLLAYRLTDIQRSSAAARVAIGLPSTATALK